MAFERITIDHEKMGGLPCIRDPRIPVKLLHRQSTRSYAIHAQELAHSLPCPHLPGGSGPAPPGSGWTFIHTDPLAPPLAVPP